MPRLKKILKIIISGYIKMGKFFRKLATSEIRKKEIIAKIKAFLLRMKGPG